MRVPFSLSSLILSHLLESQPLGQAGKNRKLRKESLSYTLRIPCKARPTGVAVALLPVTGSLWDDTPLFTLYLAHHSYLGNICCLADKLFGNLLRRGNKAKQNEDTPQDCHRLGQGFDHC